MPSPRLTTVSPTVMPAADVGMSNGQNYTIETITIEGGTPDELGHWLSRVGQLSGGDPAVIEAFNGDSQAAGRQLVDRVDAEAGIPWNYEATGVVSFRSVAIAQVITGTAYYAKAHPLTSTSTVVIDSRTARPITLTDLFADEPRGLQRLSEQTKTILPQMYGDVRVMSDQPGNAPTVENFAQWIPTAKGIEIHFRAYQFGVALPSTITVPWSALTDLLAPDMVTLAHG